MDRTPCAKNFLTRQRLFMAASESNISHSLSGRAASAAQFIPRYSARICASCATFTYVSTSALIRAANSSGVVGAGTAPVDSMRSRTSGERIALLRIPKRQRLLHRPALKGLLAGKTSRHARNKALARAYLKHHYTLAEIGQEAGLHYATISRIIKAME